MRESNYSRHSNISLAGVVLCFVLLLAACGGGGGGGGGSSDDQAEPIELAAVSALFPINGADWNDYVDGAAAISATDTLCDTATISECVHGGELRSVEVGGRSSCAGLSASDALGAFNWSCDASTNPVRMISTGLADNKHLSDLIDFATPAFLPNRVSVFENGVLADTTANSVWWNNAFEVDNDGGNLTTPSTIFLVTTDVAASYTISADGIGLVIQPGFTVTGELPIVGSDVIFGNDSRLWIEGQVDANGYNRGVRTVDAHFARLRNVSVSNAAVEAVYVIGERMNLRYITGTDSQSGIRLGGISGPGDINATLEDAFVADNSVCGLQVTGNRNRVYRLNAVDNGTLAIEETANVCLDGANADLNHLIDINASYGRRNGVLLHATSGNVSANRFHNLRLSHNAFWALYVFENSQQNSFTQLVVSNNANGVFNGVNLLSNNNFFAAVTATNNSSSGFTAANFTYLANIAASNNGGAGIQITQSDSVALNLLASNNNLGGIFLDNSSDNHFSGQLKVGNNAGGDCSVTGGTNPGLDNTCANAGSSDATATFAIDATTSFVGKVTIDDSENMSDTNGSATLAVGNAANFDKTGFDNDFRAWGADGSAFPNADNRGTWPNGFSDGRIWDWTLSLADAGDGGNPAMLDVVPLADGDDTITFGSFPQTGLRNAIEFIDDDIGDNDGFCESGESCLYTPNLGAYQGHGALISAGAFIDGALTGITLMRYAQNGR